METTYTGPLRHEPLAVELHNTLYASRGELVDGLETDAGLRAWLAAIGDRLPVRAGEIDVSRHGEFLALRGAVRDALQATLAGKPVPTAALEVVNGMAARAPVSPSAVLRTDGQLVAEARYHAADATDVALAALAADAVGLLARPGGDDLRACGAPGCVLMFFKDHPRRRWCSANCGNRARQARHYRRIRQARR
jgi:predicted RNA-binding Zn ribbon-like protein